MPHIVIATGGTGGHVYPALATAEVLRDGGHDVTFIGGDRIETRLVPAAGFPLHVLNVRALPRRPSVQTPGTLHGVMRAVAQSRDLLRETKTDVVLGMGGYASFPPTWAARSVGVPVVLHEQNARLSLANRMAMRRASALALSLPLAERRPPKVRMELTGNPIRASVAAVALDADERRRRRAQAIERWSLDPARLTVLVWGGSLGARPLNETVPTLAWREHAQILHVSGPDHEDATRRAWTATSTRATTLGYVESMEDAYSAADVVLSRSGASAVAEIAAYGLPSILVPLPFAPRGAQEANARVLERVNASRVVLQDNDFRTRLQSAVDELFSDTPQREAMGEAATKIGNPDAAASLATLVESLAYR